MTAYTKAIGNILVQPGGFDMEECSRNMLYMPDASAAAEAQMFLEEKMAQMDSAGGIVECVIQGFRPELASRYSKSWMQISPKRFARSEP